MSILGKANDSVELVKSALDAKIAIATAEDKEKLADAKLALADLKEMIADLKDENQTLTANLKKREEFYLELGVYWAKSDGDKEQPYCPVCFVKGREVPLQKQWAARPKNQSKWNCPDSNCKSSFNPWDHKEPSRIQARSW